MTEGYPGGRHAAGAIPWLFAGAGIVVAVLGVAFAVVLTGNSTPLGSPHDHRPQAAASLASVSATTPIQSPTPTPKPAHKRTPSASSSPAPSATSPSASQPQPAPSPQPSIRTQIPPVQLTATVNVDSGWHFQGFGQVVFEVADTGSTATGQLTASITLPAGASMMRRRRRQLRPECFRLELRLGLPADLGRCDLPARCDISGHADCRRDLLHAQRFHGLRPAR